MEKTAIVLSGGGSCGAYQIGVWKALKKMHISYQIVTGTSVGALNGVMMVQNDYHLAKKIWSDLNYNLLFSNFENDTSLSDKQIYLKYADEFLKNGGMDVSKLESLVSKTFSSDKFYNSNVDFGMVVYNLSKLKAENIVKKDLTKDNIKDYLIASSTCYPAFKIKEIDKQKYIDGGYSDNLPINLAISLGASKVIAVDLQQVGFKKKVKCDVDIKYIKPRNDIGSFLIFKKEISKKNMLYGYNDTMKEFGKLKGNKYTFYKYGYDKCVEKTANGFKQIVDNIVLDKDRVGVSELKEEILKKIFRLDDKNIRKKVIESMEFLGDISKIDDSRIYYYPYYNFRVKQKFIKEINIDKKTLEEFIENGAIKKNLKDVDIVVYIYNCINKNSQEIDLKMLFHFFPKEFFAAIYLTVIS